MMIASFTGDALSAKGARFQLAAFNPGNLRAGQARYRIVLPNDIG